MIWVPFLGSYLGHLEGLFKISPIIYIGEDMAREIKHQFAPDPGYNSSNSRMKVHLAESYLGLCPQLGL